MKIGLILNRPPAPSETFLISKIKGLQKNGHEIIIFANTDCDFQLCKVVAMPVVNRFIPIQIIKMFYQYILLFLKIPSVTLKFLKLEKIDGKSFRKRWENLYLNAKILNYKIDWVHFGFATTTIRKENIARAINAKMSISIRGYDIFIYPLKNPNCYNTLWEKIDKVHSISNCLLKKAKEYGLDDTIKQSIIYPAVDTSIFFRKKGEKQLINSKDSIELLTVARLHWIKGLEYVLQAIRILNSEKFNYTIVGDGVEYERLALAIDQLNLTNNVQMVGYVPHSKILSYYKEADMYIQYSLEEGFCNTVLEAQSMGILTVVSDASGLKESVNNHVTGWIVPKRDPILLSEKIKEIVSLNPEELDAVRNNAVNRIRKKFTSELQEIQFKNFFNEDLF